MIYLVASSFELFWVVSTCCSTVPLELCLLAKAGLVTHRGNLNYQDCRRVLLDGLVEDAPDLLDDKVWQEWMVFCFFVLLSEKVCVTLRRVTSVL